MVSINVTYDDGDFEELDLTQETFDVLATPLPTASVPPNPIPMDLDTTPNTDDSDRWKMVKILGDRQVTPHKHELQIQ